jgi:copper chaperone CopZ
MTSNTYEISGMTCQACVKRVQMALAPFADHVDVSLHPGQVVLQNPKAEYTQLAAALADTHYSIREAATHAAVASVIQEPLAADIQSSLGWFATYRPLLLIVVYLIVSSLLVQVSQHGMSSVHWHETMRYFMAGFFLVFSFFKLLDITAFADAYAGYDLLAKHWRAWGFIYPFVELALGLAYLANWHPLLTNWVTLVVMGFSAIGVVRAVLDKRSIQCACLGTVFKLPMSTVTIVEDVGMLMMAAMAITILN